MKKICLIKWEINGVDGGLKVACNLANELINNYEVHLISVISTGEILFELEKVVKYRNLSDKRLSMSKNYIEAHRLIKDYLKSNKIDLVIGVGANMNLLIITSTVGLKTKNISWDQTNSLYNISFQQKIQRYFSSKFSNKIIVLTKEDRSNYEVKYKINKKRVNYIYNSLDDLDTDSIRYEKGSKKLLTVGRFSEQKGYDYLAKVAVNVLSKYPDWQWDIYGSGDENIKQELIIELEKGGVLSQVNFLGNVKGTENIYPEHSIYVMTSRYEGLPLVLLEAKQYRLPIVSFNCPTGPSEIVLDDENGYLIDDYNIEKMNEKIIKLIEDRELRERFSQNSMKDTEKFNKDKILKQWINLIEKITGE